MAKRLTNTDQRNKAQVKSLSKKELIRKIAIDRVWAIQNEPFMEGSFAAPPDDPGELVDAVFEVLELVGIEIE